MTKERPGEREAFEKWERLCWHPSVSMDDAPLTRDEQGGYFNTAVHYAWLAWQARATLSARGGTEGGGWNASAVRRGRDQGTHRSRLNLWRDSVDGQRRRV